MADMVTKNRQLRLVFENGMDANGKPVLKIKNFNNIKTDAPADALLDAAEAIASLQPLVLEHVEQNDSISISRS